MIDSLQTAVCLFHRIHCIVHLLLVSNILLVSLTLSKLPRSFGQDNVVAFAGESPRRQNIKGLRAVSLQKLSVAFIILCDNKSADVQH